MSKQKFRPVNAPSQCNQVDGARVIHLFISSENSQQAYSVRRMSLSIQQLEMSATVKCISVLR